MPIAHIDESAGVFLQRDRGSQSLGVAVWPPYGSRTRLDLRQSNDIPGFSGDALKGPFRNVQPRWFKNQKQFWWEENQLITPERLALKCIDILKEYENLS